MDGTKDIVQEEPARGPKKLSLFAILDIKKPLLLLVFGYFLIKNSKQQTYSQENLCFKKN